MAEPIQQNPEMDTDHLKRHVVIETYRSRGPGGQRKNKTETSVRLKHLPTGITVTATEHRFQSRNLKLAFERLAERLLRLRQRKRKRLPTGVPVKAVERRIAEKKQRSARKQMRRNLPKDRLTEE